MAKLELKITTNIIGYTINVILMHEINEGEKIECKEVRVKHLTQEQFDKLMVALDGI